MIALNYSVVKAKHNASVQGSLVCGIQKIPLRVHGILGVTSMKLDADMCSRCPCIGVFNAGLSILISSRQRSFVDPCHSEELSVRCFGTHACAVR